MRFSSLFGRGRWDHNSCKLLWSLDKDGQTPKKHCQNRQTQCSKYVVNPREFIVPSGRCRSLA